MIALPDILSLLTAGAIAAAAVLVLRLALASEHARFDLFDQTNDAIVVSDLSGAIVRANARFFEWYGYAPEDIPRLRLRDLSDGNCAERAAAEAATVGETRQRRKDGSSFPALVSSHRMTSGGRAAVVTIIRDVSAIRATEAIWRALLETTSDAAILLDGAARVLDMNAAAERISGVPRSVALGLSTLDGTFTFYREDGSPYPVGEGPVRDALAGLARRGVMVGFDRPDGRRIWTELNAEPMFLAGEGAPSHLAVTFRDVTERRRAQDLQRALAEVERRMVGRLDRAEVLDAVSRGVVELGARLAWIGATREDGTIEVAARAGEGAAPGAGDEAPAGIYQAAAAVRTGKAQRADDGAVLALPLAVALDRQGALVACAAADSPFDPPLVAVLESLARQASIALRAADAHARLAESEARYRQILETTHEGVWLVDDAANTTYVNPRMAEILGREPAAMIGRPLFEFVPDGWLRAGEEAFERRRRGLPDAIEFPVRRLDGTEVWTQVSTTPIRDATGRYTGALAMVTDITSRRKAEEAMRRVTLAVEQVSESIVIADLEERIVYVNPAACRSSGYTEEELLGRPLRFFRDDTAEAQAAERAIWETIRAGGAWKGIVPLRRKDGKTIQEAVVVAPVRRADGQIVDFVAVKRDVTREQQLEAQLRQAQKLEAVGQLAGGVAHDFNNALAGVVGYADLALLELPPKDPIREHLVEIRRSADRAAAIARQLLVFSRRQAVELRTVDLDEIVEGLSKMLRRLMGEEVRVEMALGGDLGAIRADAAQIEQVITNLCLNARDAMPGGGRITISTARVEPGETVPAPLGPAPDAGAAGAAPAGGWVVLSIADTGTGMTPEVRARLFEPFFTTKPKGKGTGLGLPVVHGIIARHGGAIDVETAPGRGTTFRIYLPCLGARAAPSPEPSPAAPLPRGTETILLVEDEEEVRGMTARALERLGYKVLVASSGYEALGLADRYPGEIDLLVTDVVMPDLPGPRVAADLGSRRAGLRTLFISGYASDYSGERAELDPAAAYLAKPFGAGDLARKVRAVLEQPAAPRPAAPLPAPAAASVSAD